MCGIYGFAGRSAAHTSEAVARRLDTITHRGPDGSGVWTSPDDPVVLAHRRLAIVDLSPSGAQPMHDESGGLHITFNGEIYNYTDLREELAAHGYAFRSSSDTEVVLAAYARWGEACLSRLQGMFAFALHDPRSRRVFLARDRAGEKPLFYKSEKGSLEFASELKALMRGDGAAPRIDPAALDCYLAFGYVPGELCMLQGVRKLPPAHALSFGLDDGELRVWRYWSLPDCPAEAALASRDEDLVDELESILEDSVRRQLVADVPVGILLSGGVDSSLTTAMAARTGSEIRTFTVSFPGYGGYDESEYARSIASYFGTRHTELEARSSSVGLLPTLARQFDEPMADSSMIPTYLVSMLVREHCKVALGGDGGDELFGGYIHHNRLLWLQQHAKWAPLAVRRAAARAARLLPTGFKGRNWLQAWGTDLRSELPLIATQFSESERRRLLAGRLGDDPAIGRTADPLRRSRVPAGCDLLQRVTRMDFENYLPEDILVKVDRASMLASLEVRAPWLDHRLIEFAFGKVPARLKATSTERKILPKMLAKRVLPQDFDLKRKQGFSIPLARWLKGAEWGGFFRDVLTAADSMFDRRYVTGLLDGQERGRANNERLFALVLLELWRREYNVAI